MDPTLAVGMPADRCARQIVAAVRRRRFEITVGTFGQRLIVRLKRLSSALFHFVAQRVPAQ